MGRHSCRGAPRLGHRERPASLQLKPTRRQSVGGSCRRHRAAQLQRETAEVGHSASAGDELFVDPTNYYVYGTLTAHVVFVVLLLVGISFGELGLKRGAIFSALWATGYVGSRYVSFGGTVFGPFLFVPYVALLDVILAGVIFSRLGRLT
jgi:hypothetical protein